MEARGTARPVRTHSRDSRAAETGYATATTMKTILVIIFLSVAVSVLAQGPPQLSPDVQQLVTQLHAVGCQAEETAAAQTIDQLRKENEKLKAQIQKLDPPPKSKSGATAH